MKKFFLILFAFLTIGTLLFIGYELYYVKKAGSSDNDSNNDNKTIKENNYKYYDELYSLGYSKENIDVIKDNISEENVQKYLLQSKYDYLIEYIKSNYFKTEHISRYDEYDAKTEYDKKSVVMYVEIGLDIEFYTNINEVTNYTDKLVLVNKYNKLPSNYNASDLVVLEGKYSSNSQKMKNEAAVNMKAMIDDAKEKGYSMKVVSGYRTESLQNTLFTNSTKRNGIEHALIYSARPGHSEHQTGFAADINSVEESFAKTKEYTYLNENAHKFGFIERYPKRKEFITGYGYEPWHYRYVGVEAATIISEKNITFEEYAVMYLDYSSSISE